MVWVVVREGDDQVLDLVPVRLRFGLPDVQLPVCHLLHDHQLQVHQVPLLQLHGFGDPVLEVWRVESLLEEPHVGVMVPVNLIRQLHHLQSHVHQSLVGSLILGGLLGCEGALLQVVIDHVHLHDLYFCPLVPCPGNPSHQILEPLKIHLFPLYQAWSTLNMRCPLFTQFIDPNLTTSTFYQVLAHVFTC